MGEFDRYALSQRQHKLSLELQDQIKLKVRQNIINTNASVE